jgi:hypothetical protein
MIGMLMQAPSRWRLGKIGSSPTNVMVPPVSSGDSPRSSMTDRKWASTSKPRDMVEVVEVIVLTTQFLSLSRLLTGAVRGFASAPALVKTLMT